MNTTLTEKTADGSYVDWPAIFAGTVVAVAIGLLLTTFGAALGLSSITLDGTDNSSTLELVLTALWMVITLVASYLAGGYIAGRMRRRVESATDDEVTARDGINGLVVWGLGSVITAVLLSSALSFAANTAGNVAVPCEVLPPDWPMRRVLQSRMRPRMIRQITCRTSFCAPIRSTR